MLSDDDRALVRRDPGLAGLALALDADAVATRLGTGALSPRYLSYKPGETCTAHFDDGGAGITLRAVTPERFAIYRERAEWRRPGSPVRFLDDVNAVAMPGTLDRGIRVARRLLDPRRAGRELATLIGPGEDNLHVLRLKPGRRIVARIDRAGRPHALLKAVPPSAFQALFAAARLAADTGGPRILGQDAKRGLLAQAWIAGETADPRSATPRDFTRIGEALAAMHRRPAPCGSKRPHPACEALTAAGAILPDLAAETRALGHALGAALAGEVHTPVLCHGDFSADQVVLSDGEVRIIDFDRSGPGLALGDVGSFLADLDAAALVGSLDAERADVLGRAFVEGYARVAGTVSDEAIAPYRAASLAALVAEPFRARRPNWAAEAAAILRRAAELLGARGLVAHALGREVMERAISAALGRPLRLDPPELLRERAGRRALIAYRGNADGRPFEALGKLRVKGLDRRTPALHRRLVAAGFAGEVGVPEVLGILPEAQVWLQAQVEGRLLTDLLAPGGPTAPLAATGRALARLHGVAPADLGGSDLRVWSMADEVAVLADALSKAGKARPALAPALARLEAELAGRALALSPAPATGIHRDFYPDQVIVGRETTWLLDLDLFALGDPAIDVANFVAHLREFGLRRWGDPGALAAQEAAFLAGYTAAAPLPDPARLDLLTMISLARHAWISIRSPGRSHITEAMVALCSSEHRSAFAGS